ncbi:hypothetical protein IEQ34_003371 [Dendrobium chrysotoxum]|uniref:TRAF-type domain-containing protein n=1 Tax=Dendrobium chrysotoxum TaxID=161865 RepID=A0AAV7HL44_DENCH|nr:hypothetical protein IEQ34_003371 [Dendrobium chrysotoxum]
MDLPVSDLGPIKNSGAASLSCPHCDAELVRKIAQLLLPGLATACVDSTTGDFFRTPAIVAVDIRKEMVDYLNHRTETYISDLLLAHESPGDSSANHSEPVDIISELIEDFTASKRNIFSRVSGWILSDTRDDRIDDFVHEMDTNRFWSIDRREVISEVLLRNLDYKSKSHCSMRFDEERELEVHRRECEFRPVACGNEGCKVKFCAVREEEHDGVCAYKVLSCDQKCGEMVLRREMDRHCVTVCKMKLMNCPFYQVGCESGIPRCRVEEHCRDELQRHLICVLPVIHRDEVGLEDAWKERATALAEAQSDNELAEALNVRALVTAIKNLEAKIRISQEDDSDSSRTEPTSLQN